MDDAPTAIDDDPLHSTVSTDVPSPPPKDSVSDLQHTIAPEEEPTTAAESDEEMDAEEDAPDTNIKKPGNKKQKKGLTVRDCISAAAVAIASDEQPEKKRKDVFGTEVESTVTLVPFLSLVLYLSY